MYQLDRAGSVSDFTGRRDPETNATQAAILDFESVKYLSLMQVLRRMITGAVESKGIGIYLGW